MRKNKAIGLEVKNILNEKAGAMPPNKIEIV